MYSNSYNLPYLIFRVLVFVPKNRNLFINNDKLTKIFNGTNCFISIFLFLVFVTGTSTYARQNGTCESLYNTLLKQNEVDAESSLTTAEDLLACIKKNKPESSKANEYLFQIGLSYKKNFNLEKALIIFNELIENKSLPSQLSLSILNEIVDIHYQKSRIVEFKKSTLQQLKLAEKVSDTSHIVEALFNLGFYHKYYSNYDSAYYAYSKAMKLSLAMKDQLKYNRIKLSFAGLTIDNNEYYKALKLLKEIEVYTKAVNNTELLSDTYFFLAIIHRKIGKFEEAIEYYNNVLPLYKKNKSFDRLPKLYGNLGIIYREINNNERALNSYLKALEYTKEYDDNLKCGLNSMIGTVYIDMGEFEKGIDYLKRGLSICERINSTIRLAENYLSTAKYYKNRPFEIKKLDYDSALYYNNKSLEIYKKVDNKSGQVKTLGEISQVHLVKNEVEKSKKYLIDGLAISRQDSSPTNQSYILDLLTKLYRKTGDYKKADEFNLLNQEILENVHKTQLNKQLTENLAYYDYLLSVKQDSLQHEHRIELQKTLLQEKDKTLTQQSSAIIIISIILILLIILFFIVSNRNKELMNARKQIAEQKEQVELQHDELSIAYSTLKTTQRKLMEKEKLAAIGSLTYNMAHELKNPFHFVKGAAMAIKDVWCKTNNINDKKLLNLLDGIEEGINRMDKVIGSLYGLDKRSIESENVDLYEIVEKCFSLLKHDYKNTVELKNDLNQPTNLKINNASIQIIVNNILKNSFEAIEEQGYISISAEITEEFQIIKFTDNGKGINEQILEHIFEPFYSTKLNVSGVGIGLFQVYNLLKDIDCDLKIDSTIHKGTTVYLYFKKPQLNE